MAVGVNTEKRCRGLAVVGLQRLLDEAAVPWRDSPARDYLELLQDAGLARVEHYNVALARCTEAEDLEQLLAAMDSAGIEKCAATATTLFSRHVEQSRFGQALAALEQVNLSEEERTRMLGFYTNTLKRLCDERGDSKRGDSFLEALIGFGVANVTHFNVCLNAVQSSAVEPEIVELEVTAEISRLMVKMDRAGVQPDGSTYSTLHSVWLRLDNVKQAVGALAQAKQRAADPRRKTGDHESRDSDGIGGPLWDEEMRSGEICRQIRAMDTASEGAKSGRRAAKSGKLWGYYDELQRQRLATITTHNTMLEVCRLSVEVDTIITQMEGSGCQANRDTYPALHRAWVFPRQKLWIPVRKMWKFPCLIASHRNLCTLNEITLSYESMHAQWDRNFNRKPWKCFGVKGARLGP
jgi:hypothetical protein